MLSRTERDAIKLLAKAKYSYRFLPEWMKFRGPPMNATQTKMEFANESYIESLPSARDPARGESVYLAVIDELAYLPNSDEAWASIEPIADVGGRVIALSTANGEGNLFHKLWVGATHQEQPVQGDVPPVVGERPRPGVVRRTKAADLPEWQMAQEYPDNPDDAFLQLGSSGVLHRGAPQAGRAGQAADRPRRLPRLPQPVVRRRPRRTAADLGVAGRGRALRHRRRPGAGHGARRLLAAST